MFFIFRPSISENGKGGLFPTSSEIDFQRTQVLEQPKKVFHEISFNYHFGLIFSSYFMCIEEKCIFLIGHGKTMTLIDAPCTLNRH